MKLWIAACAAMATMMPAAGRAEDPQADSAYVLGPQDRLAIRVNSLRRNTGEIYTWTPLSDEFAVGADGTIFLPIVGQLSASGTTPDGLALAISEALRKAANLAEMPFTTVEVASYRPVYVMGAVQQPGRYEFQPGMTVLQALSTAQGFVRSPDVSYTQREALSAGGDVRELEAEDISLQARQARLIAESTTGETGLSFPPELRIRASEDPRVVTAMDQETERYNAGRDALTAEIAAIGDARILLEQELASLGEKETALNEQQALYDKEVATSTELLGRGLTVSSRQVDAQNSQLAVRSSLLDVQLAKLRAQQALQRADRDEVDLRARYHTTALDNLVATREQLERNRQRLQTAQALLTLSMSRSLDMLDSADTSSFTAEYRVVRASASGQENMVVPESFVLRPGDVLQVQMSRKQAPGQ